MEQTQPNLIDNEKKVSKKLIVNSDGKLIRKNGRAYRLKPAHARKEFFFPGEWLRFYSLQREKNKLAFDILIQTGARINEARNITPGDISAEGRSYIKLRVTKVRSKLGERDSTPRLIPISTQFRERLLRYAKQNNMKQDDKFPMLSTPRVLQILRADCGSIGKKNAEFMSAHNIRKTFENWLIGIGKDPFKVAQHMGHTLVVSAANYVSPDIFSKDDKILIRDILGDLYL